MTEPIFKWIAESWSVTGSSHTRASTCNQDYGSVDVINNGQILIAAVADGHGSKKCFRSERGSKFAVESAISNFKSYILNLPNSDIPSAIRNDISIEMPRAIVRDWQRKVDLDLFENPPSCFDLDKLSESERKNFESNPRVAYGATLVGALVMSEISAFIQIGDGDLLIVTDLENGPNSIRPIPPDPKSFANYTASLSTNELNTTEKRPHGGGGPWSDFRTRFIDNNGNPPAFILLTTDGYPNAFISDAAFQSVASDIISIIKTEGWEMVRSHMPIWLEDASRNGSGDDATVAIAFRSELLESKNEPNSSHLNSSDVNSDQLTNNVDEQAIDNQIGLN